MTFTNSYRWKRYLHLPLLALLTTNGLYSSTPCDTKPCKRVYKLFSDPNGGTHTFVTREEAQESADFYFILGEYISGPDFVGGDRPYAVTWQSSESFTETDCPPETDQPVDNDPQNDPGASSFSEPAEETQDCASCTQSTAPTQSGNNPNLNYRKSTTGINFDVGLGRGSNGKAFGRLRFGFEFDGSESLGTDMSLDYNPAKGKFRVQDYMGSGNAFTPTTGRPTAINNSNVKCTFVWFDQGGKVQNVSVKVEPATGISTSSERYFETVTYTFAKLSATSMKITEQRPGVLRSVTVTGTATSKTSYNWTINRFDGSTVTGSSLPPAPTTLEEWRTALGDPTLQMRWATITHEPADQEQLTVVTENFYKLLFNDQAAQNGSLLLQTKVSPEGAVPRTTTYTYHETVPVEEGYKKNLISSITYDDGTWVAYPEYDASKKPTVELRPWVDGPATATEGLQNEALCRKIEIWRSVQNVTKDFIRNLFPDGDSETVLPELITETHTESVGGIILSTRREQVAVVKPVAFGGPFASGQPLEGHGPVITTLRTVYDGGSDGVTSMSVQTLEEVFGDPNDALFNGRFEPDGTFRLRWYRTDMGSTSQSGSYEEQTYNGHVTAYGSSWIDSRSERAVRHIYNAGGHASERREVLYTSENDNTGTVVSTTLMASFPTSRGITRDGVNLSSEQFSDVQLNGRSCRKTVRTDQDGVITESYADYETGERVQMVKQGGPTVTITRAGQVTTTLTTAGSLSTREVEEVDEQERPVQSIDRNGRITSYSYSPDGRTTTMTLPGGGTRITTYYLDGKLASITGTAQVAEYHTYAVNEAPPFSSVSIKPLGSVTETIALGSAASERITTVTRDGAGNLISDTDAEGTHYYTYDYKNEIETKGTVGSAAVQHFSSPGFEVLGSKTSFLEVTSEFNGEWLIENYQSLKRSNRVVHEANPYYQTGTATFYYWNEEKVQQYGAGLSGGQTRTTITRERISGQGANRYWHRIDPDGTITVFERIVTPATKTVVETVKVGTATIAPAIMRVTTYINGLLKTVVQNGTTDVTTTHSYDGLEQWTGSTGGAAASSATYRTYSGGGATRTSSEFATQTTGGVTTSYGYDSAGRVVLSTSPAGAIRTTYDLHGRLTRQWGATYPVAYSYDSVTGDLVTMKTYEQDSSDFLQTSNASPPAAFGSTPAALTTWIYHPVTGKLTGKRDHAGETVSYAYDVQGRLTTRTWARGAKTNYNYDLAGRLAGITYSGATAESFDGTSAVAYTYNSAGDILSISDGSGLRTTTFDAKHLPAGESLASAHEGTWSRDANINVPPTPITFTTSRPAPYLNKLTSTAPVRRKQTFSLARSPAGPFGVSTIIASEREFHPDGKAASVLALNAHFAYAYDVNGRLKTVTTTHKTTATGTATAVSNSLRTYVYDAAGRVEKLLYGGAMSGNTPPATIHSGWQYTHDTAGRRDVVSSIATGTNEQVGWDYDYTGRGEVMEAKRLDATTSAAFLHHTYLYAANGSRRNEASYKEGGSIFSSALQSHAKGRSGDPTAIGTLSRGKPDSYSFNGSTFVTTPGYQVVEVSGHYSGTLRSGTEPTITQVNGTDITDPAEKNLGLPASYRRTFQVNNPNATVGYFAQTTVTTTDSSAAPGKTNVLKTWQYVPPKTETLAYDEDGNLRADARWKLTWDAENRLAVMEERADIPHLPATAAFPPPRQRIEFVYDSHHRRCAKKVFRWNSTIADWGIWASTLYFYDGWNLVAELDALNACTPLRTYAWGVDLSGSMSGAGGVGGLLMVKRHMRTYVSGATADKSLRYLVHSDANGNVKGFASIPLTGTTFTTTMTGSWDYDAFGNRVSNTIPVAHELCRIGFSSKYDDLETGWLNYTFRLYRPDTGAWLSRDPIEEEGGTNLYGMCSNDCVNLIDVLGNDPLKFDPSGMQPNGSGTNTRGPNGQFGPKAPFGEQTPGVTPRPPTPIKPLPPANPSPPSSSSTGNNVAGSVALAADIYSSLFKDDAVPAGKAKCQKQSPNSFSGCKCCVVNIYFRLHGIVLENNPQFIMYPSSGSVHPESCAKTKEKLWIQGVIRPHYHDEQANLTFYFDW